MTVPRAEAALPTVFGAIFAGGVLRFCKVF